MDTRTSYTVCASSKPEQGLCVDQVEDGLWDVKLARNLVSQFLALEDPLRLLGVEDLAAHPVTQQCQPADSVHVQSRLDHTTQSTQCVCADSLFGGFKKSRRHKRSPEVEHDLVVQLLANDVLPALVVEGEGCVRDGHVNQGVGLTSGNALRQDTVDWMRMAEALHWSPAGCVHPMRSNRETTSTIREARRTMIALQGWVQRKSRAWHGRVQCWALT